MSYALVVITLFFLLSIYLALRSKKVKPWITKGGLLVDVVMALY